MVRYLVEISRDGNNQRLLLLGYDGWFTKRMAGFFGLAGWKIL
jgi:hypothetical protein